MKPGRDCIAKFLFNQTIRWSKYESGAVDLERRVFDPWATLKHDADGVTDERVEILAQMPLILC